MQAYKDKLGTCRDDVKQYFRKKLICQVSVMPHLKRTSRVFSNVKPDYFGDVEAFPDPLNNLDQCAHAIGCFMISWDRVELAAENLLRLILDTDAQRTYIIATEINASGVRSIIEKIGSHRLDKASNAALKRTLESLRKATERRNKIVHGRWTIVIQKNNGIAVSAEWKRVVSFKDSIDLDAKLVGDTQKAKSFRDRNIYSIDSLYAAAHEADALAKHINDLSQSLKSI